MLKSVTKSKRFTDSIEKNCIELKREKEALLRTLEERQLHLKLFQRKALQQNFNQLSRKPVELDAQLNTTLQRIPNNEEIQEFENNQSCAPNIKQLVSAFSFFNNVEFTIDDKTIIDDSGRYLLHATSGPVEFYVQFIWNEASNKCSNIDVSLSKVFHRQELASRINKCVRDSNLVKLIGTITQYSELYVQRENTLKKLSKLKEVSEYFKFHKAKDQAGYSIDILDERTGFQYIKANWGITYFKARYVMDHTFNIKVMEGAEELGQEQEGLLVKLTKKEDFSEEEIIEIFTRLTKAFDLWIMNS